MARRVRDICLVAILGLGLLFSVTSGENCPINPECSCPFFNVYCRLKFGPNISKFACSSKTLNEVWITGTRDINRILPETFQGLSTKKLSIRYTGLTEIDCDDFKGIASGLKELHLGSNHLESIPSCSLQHTTSITRLQLSENHISKLTRDAFRYVPDLQSLHLKNNEIGMIEIGTFNTLSKLKYLYLDQNKISHLEGSMFAVLRYLISLYIRGNQIKSVHPKAFEGLESLAHLYLNDNKLGALDRTVFDHLVNIYILDLRINAIPSLSDKLFVKNTKLVTLYLNNNQLVSLPYNIFQPTTNLKNLYLNDNQLVSLPYNIFQTTTNLKMLYLNNNQLVSLPYTIFQTTPNLETLYLNGNQLVSLPYNIFQTTSKLIILYLSDNHLVSLPYNIFQTTPKLSTLHIDNNNLSTLDHRLLSYTPQSLRVLNLQSNRFTTKSWLTLTPILTTLDNLDNLDLSHNPVGDIPASVISSLKDSISLNIRNCSLTSTPTSEYSYHDLDLSANNFKHTSAQFSFISFSSLNVSHNKLKSISVRLIYYHNNFVDAQQNEIKSTSIDLSLFSTRNYMYVELFQLSKNLIADSLLLSMDSTYRVTVRELVLSYNRFTKVTQYPLLFNSLLPAGVDWYDRINIDRLNISHNSIAFVSPYAFLGLIENLDLSHNRIEVLNRLLPANISTYKFRTRYLNISDNRIHRITHEAFHGFENIVANINLAKNALTEIESLRIVLEATFFDRLYLSENPLNCDCDSFWLRQDAVYSKLDPWRCDQRDDVKGFLSFCYPLVNCPPNQTTDISASVLDLCKSDNTIIISDLKLIQSEAVGISSRVNVSWTRHGPGIITGYTLETAPREQSEKMMTSLVHPAAVYFILSDLEFEVAYNVCISAQMKNVTISEITCATLTLESTDDNIIISKSILIGISSALGLCVLCVVAMLVGYFIRRKKTATMDSPRAVRTDIPTPHTRSNLSEIQNNASNLNDNQNNLTNPAYISVNPDESYENPVNVSDETTNTYETIHSAHYENSPTETTTSV